MTQTACHAAAWQEKLGERAAVLRRDLLADGVAVAPPSPPGPAAPEGQAEARSPASGERGGAKREYGRPETGERSLHA